MNATKIIKAIVKLYFVGAVTGSFVHVMNAWQKLGLETAESIGATLMIDGMFIIAMFLRSDAWSTRTNRVGFRLFLVMGAFSLAGNVYSAHNAGGIVFGAMLPGAMMLGEWLADGKQLVTRTAELAQIKADEAAAKKAASIAKGQATRKRNARTKAAQVKALESLLKK